MPDERPEENPSPRFGRRPRQSTAPAPGGEAPVAPPKKVRIGPRRPVEEAHAAPPPPPQPPEGLQPPRGGVRKPRGGGNPAQGQNLSEKPQGGIKRKPLGKNGPPSKGNSQGKVNPRRPDRPGAPSRNGPGNGFSNNRNPLPTPGEVQDRPEREFQGPPAESPQGNPHGVGLSRNARRRKRRKDRRDDPRLKGPEFPDAPAEIGESAFEVRESDHDDMEPVTATGISTVFPETSFLDAQGDDDDFDEEGETGSDLPVAEGEPPAASGPVRESRSKRRRKKRRERSEPPPVDRGSGYWWAEQWMRSFEVLYGGGASRARLQKGRSYARRGQVTELEVGPNGVIARVQGSRPKPYQVRLELNRLRRETWGRILHQLAGKAAFLAQLLEGTLPPEIEDVFFAAGARLFPHGENDVRSRCTCPDPVVPCKHVAAVDFVLADALQRDPFLLFALRGKSRDQFLQDLRDMRVRESGRREPLSSAVEDLGQFWRMGRLAESVVRPTGWGSGGDPARLIQSLGEPQLEGIREGLFLPMLESTYRQVSEGMRRLPKDD